MVPFSYLEVRLDWLIAQSGIVRGSSFRRLNAIENMLASLSNSSTPIDPSKLRICEATRAELFEWVTANEPPTGDLVVRLDVYRADEILSASVRQGWLYLALPTESP